MNPAEECLQCLKNKDWTKLSSILSDNKNARILAESPTFLIFENILIDELIRHEIQSSEDLHIVAARVFQLHQQNNSLLHLTKNGHYKIARYLFDKNPQENYAKALDLDEDAQQFLGKCRREAQNRIDNNRISASLNIKIGERGKLRFDKDIFNDSPQEKELYVAARRTLSESILLPNIALSTIISPKVCGFLDQDTTSYFYKSTLDLCVVNPTTFRAELCIELDSSWHDQPRSIENDKRKNIIFEKAGLTLHRLRKKKNKNMEEIFELFIKNHASERSR